MSAGRALRQLRSLLSVLLLAPLFMLGGILQRFVVWPLVVLLPARRDAFVTVFMKGMSATIFAILRLGGARTERHGQLRTDHPAIVVMNHQSLLDIPMAVLLSSYAPMFVTRRRYARFVPVVSLCLRLLEAPLIEPGDRRGSLVTMRQATQRQRHGILLFPEGHRTLDGEIQAFHTAGLQMMLRERRLPVYLLVTDGYWACRRLVDFAFHVHEIRGKTEVLGPFEPPQAEEELPTFLASLRETMVAQLAQMRETARRAA